MQEEAFEFQSKMSEILEKGIKVILDKTQKGDYSKIDLKTYSYLYK